MGVDFLDFLRPGERTSTPSRTASVCEDDGLAVSVHLRLGLPQPEVAEHEFHVLFEAGFRIRFLVTRVVT